MSGGSWNGVPAGTSRAHYGAWSRIRLGWLTATDVTTSLIGTSIPKVETTGGRASRLGIARTFPPVYFLMETRQPVGFDAALPGSGLLIWHVDESQTTNDVDTHRLLDLEEADEALTGDHPTDSGDPWHDTATGWGPDTVPDSRSYSGSETEWRIRDISPSGATMTATIARDVTKDPAASPVRPPLPTAPGKAGAAAVGVRDDGAQSADATLNRDAYLGSVG